ncbi:hypothetical protein POTOM_035192 [Populus tomentosa]|uniref:RNase H type-1 domain-containing protein n=1 Tax=Populus tomentosa TaxID=118781 RepID=A0A8X7Z3N6_POPTO|nr:hypothetical protein POTOM_035192 [Populus tomentosa]
MDGCSKGNPGNAAAGGLIRDSMGTWINLGIFSSVLAELWAAITGLQPAWSLGLRTILLESDSSLVLDMITKQDSTVDTNYALVSRVKDALTWGWAVTVPHALGEGILQVNLGPGRNPLYRDGWRINDPPTVFYLTLILPSYKKLDASAYLRDSLWIHRQFARLKMKERGKSRNKVSSMLLFFILACLTEIRSFCW